MKVPVLQANNPHRSGVRQPSAPVDAIVQVGGLDPISSTLISLCQASCGGPKRGISTRFHWASQPPENWNL